MGYLFLSHQRSAAIGESTGDPILANPAVRALDETMFCLFHLNDDAGIDFRPNFADERAILDSSAQHHRLIQRILESEIGVVVHDCCATSERDCALVVGEQVKAVAVSFGDAHACLDRHPVEAVRHLTQTAADAPGRRTVAKFEPVVESAPASRPSERMVMREDLPGGDHQAVEQRRGQPDICLFPILEPPGHGTGRSLER